MKVVIDAHMLGMMETGNETYCLNLIQQAAAFREFNVEIYPLVHQATGRVLENSQVVHLANHDAIHRLTVALPRAVRLVGAAGLHVTYHAPFWLDIPYVVTIHDVSYRTHPYYHRPRNVFVQNLLGALSAYRARAAITVSQFCRREILRIYPFLKDRLFVTPEAANTHWHPRPQAATEFARERLRINQDYLLWVGGFQPRKNLIRLVEAFLRATQANDSVQLVLVGNHVTKTGKAVLQRFSEAIRQRRVILTGYVDNETLACLYSGCVGFVFPSLYEGFGLPLLEAMQCGAPVITSNITALPEVAGDAALLIEPTDTDAIAHAIHRVVNEPDLRAALRERGFRRAAQFSWQQTARLTAEVYRFAFS